MKVLITGCYGQVGTELMNLAADYGFVAIGMDHDTLDITDKAAVKACLLAEKPSVVINAAAYTAVDKAENDQDTAFAVNATAVGYLAASCESVDIPLIHISTDYVFDGSKSDGYVEDDVVSPLGVYGTSKLAGEEEVKKKCNKHYIFRTSWVFSAHGNNFVKTMLRLGTEREVLGVVADQLGKPTSAREISRVIYEVIKSNKHVWGTYHLAQPKTTSWAVFAKIIFEQGKAARMPLKIKHVNEIDTKDYPTPARRPAHSELDCGKLETVFNLKINPWQESLIQVIEELKNE